MKLFRWLKISTFAALTLIAVVVSSVGLYTFLYADHFLGGWYLSRISDDPIIQLEARLHSHWRKLGTLYLVIGALAGVGARVMHRSLWRRRMMA